MKATYGVNFDRMVALKTKFDPNNLFRLNANVAPAGRARSGKMAPPLEWRRRESLRLPRQGSD